MEDRAFLELRNKILQYIEPRDSVSYEYLIVSFGEESRRVLTVLEKEGAIEILVTPGGMVDVRKKTLETSTPLREHFSNVLGSREISMTIGDITIPVANMRYNREVDIAHEYGTGSITPLRTVSGNISYTGSFDVDIRSTTYDEAHNLGREIMNLLHYRRPFDLQLGDITFRNCYVTGIGSEYRPRDGSTADLRCSADFRCARTTRGDTEIIERVGHIETFETSMAVGTLDDLPTENARTVTMGWSEL